MPVNIIDTLKPKNGGSFPIVEAIDVFVENYGNLAEAVSHFATDVMIEAINTVLSGKANTSDVNASVANLQGQIDQIVISASAEAVVAPEVAAARVDAEGNSYTTLKERIDNSELFARNNVKDLSTDICKSSNDIAYNNTTLASLADREITYLGFVLGTVVDPSSTTRMTVNGTVTVTSGIKVYAKKGYKIAIYNTDQTRVTEWVDSWLPNASKNVYISLKADDDSDFTSIYSTAKINEYIYSSSLIGAEYITKPITVPDTQKNLNEINDDLNYIFSDHTVTYLGFVLGNSASTSALDPTRMSCEELISIPAGTTIRAINNFEFALYTSTKQLITSGWVTKFTTVPALTSCYFVLRKVNQIDLTSIYSSLKIYDCASSSTLIGATVTRTANFVTKSYEIADWYRTRMRFDPMVVEPTTIRLCNITSYNQPDNLNAGDQIEIQLLDSVNYKYTFSLFSGTTRVQDYWAYRHEPITVTVNQPCYLGIMLCKDDDTQNIDLSEASNIIVKIIPNAQQKKSKWDGKTAVFVGDSITYGINTEAGKRYWEYLASKCGFIATGMGVAGSCYSVTSDYGSQHDPIASRWTNIPQKDLIVLFAGTNDYGHGTPLGTIDDATDISFYGALNVVIGGLVNKYPSSRLVIMTPLHRYNFGGLEYDTEKNAANCNLYDYVNALKAIGEKYGVPIIDTFSTSGMNPMVAAIKTTYVTDGLHPNADGHALIADRTYQLFNTM